mmetsp:Transcript_8905/g.7898  ORF Transcript_8905/g.7898 Transcript_8905/m.7898 type:complete len:235 (+) Transcript_8905:45-749(+)
MKLWRRNSLDLKSKHLKKNKSYPLDYIMNLPEKYFENAGPGKHEAILRENIFKNVVMRRLYEIREQKSKPKLLQQLDTKNISDWKARIQIKRKIKELKERAKQDPTKDDVSTKFNRLITNLERTLKVLTYENIALNNIETKLMKLSKTEQEVLISPQKSIKKAEKPKTKTKIQAYERIEDEEYDNGEEEAKADRIKEISKVNYGIKNLNGGIDIIGGQKEELEFSFSSQSSNGM